MPRRKHDYGEKSLIAYIPKYGTYAPPAGQLGALAPPQKQDVPLSSTAQVVLPLVYQSTKSLQSPLAPVVWYGSAAIAGSILLYGPAGLQASWGFALTHPAVVNCVADFAYGFASPPGGYSSFCGAAGQWASTVWGAH